MKRILLLRVALLLHEIFSTGVYATAKEPGAALFCFPTRDLHNLDLLLPSKE